MTNEELMIHREEVIEDYPHSPFEIGMILRPTADSGELYSEAFGYTQSRTAVNIRDVNKYRNIFRKMEWWEKRDMIDMPQYLKLVYGNSGFIHKVVEWVGVNSNNQPLYSYHNRVGYLTTACVIEMIPATEQEYNDYKNKPKL